MKRFKIDMNDTSMWPFGLYRRRPCWDHFITSQTYWERVSMWETREAAKKHYDLIKDLPEYLD